MKAEISRWKGKMSRGLRKNLHELHLAEFRAYYTKITKNTFFFFWRESLLKNRTVGVRNKVKPAAGSRAELFSLTGCAAMMEHELIGTL
jgi:hypothetical protein